MKEELIKITTNDEGKQLVSARELHEGLGVEKKFTQWIENQLNSIDATENTDYTKIIFKDTLSKTGQTKTDYIITVDTAKEICMVVGVSPRTNSETKALSKEFRKYFIECEKKLKTQVPQLTEEQKLALLVFEGGFSAVEASKKMVELQTKPLLETIETQKPKVEYVDKFMNGDGLFLISEIAKKVGITAVRANNILKDNKIIYKNGRKYYPYAKTPKDWYGYQESVSKDGTVYSQLKWTSKGVYEITKILEDNK